MAPADSSLLWRIWSPTLLKVLNRSNLQELGGSVVSRKRCIKGRLLSNCAAGGRYGATFIDKEFLGFLESRVENLDILPRDFANSGHFVLMPRGKHLLQEFERVKHAFDGKKGGDVYLPRGAVLAADVEDEGAGVISLTA